MSDHAPAAMPPITCGLKRKEILATLAYRAKHPEVWAAQWPDDPELLAVRDRFSHILLHDCGHWPSAFFIPDDDIYTIVATDRFTFFDAGFDAVDLIMGIEERFDIKIDDETAMKMPFSAGKSTYRMFLQAIINICDPEKDVTGGPYEWKPFRLPANYFEQSFWHNVKRRLPFTWTNHSLHRELRRLQATRPSTWPNQWADYDGCLIQIRDRVSRILVAELEWFDEAFIPQDRLAAVFHSRHGLEQAAKVLAGINEECKSDLAFDFITSEKHTYAGFLKKLAEAA